MNSKDQLIAPHLPIKMITSYLNKLGYSVNKLEGEDWYSMEGNGIKGFVILNGFYRDTRDYPYLHADHVECFDKESKCPLSIRLPKNTAELQHLTERLRFWGSPEGFEISNNYEHEKYDTNEYPK